MHLAFSSKSYLERGAQDPNKNHPPVELERAGSEEVPTQNKKVDADKSTSNGLGATINHGKSTTQLINASIKRKLPNDTIFYNKPFVYNESERNVRDLVVSPFTKRIKDYEMPDGLKVPSNLKSYDGLLDPDDHLMMFMGTMDVHKLPEPAWCRIFNITLCGAARFWYDNLSPESIDDKQNDAHQKRSTSKSTTQLINSSKKRKLPNDTIFYNKPFVYNESERNVRDLVASPFTKRIKDYEMPDGLKIPSNLKSYDGLLDPNDHLTMFMGTMDVHILPEPAWCRIFNITLCGAARFWYDNLSPESIDNFHQLWEKFRANFMQQRRFQKTQAEILGIRQKSEESLKDYLARFGKETLHMTDISDVMMIGAFISGLRPGRPFKDLIARPPTSLEDLYIHVNGCIRADEANNVNRLRDMKE
ncbi:gag protein [Tanacetum coccineum]